MAFEQAAASNANMQIKEQAAYNYALCLHETSFSAFGESVTAFEKFLNEFPTSPYAEKVSSYLVEVYMNTRSYDAALKSIDRIAKPSAQILEAKQKILFQLGTQSFANADFEQALKYLNQSIAIGQYNRQTKADAYYWCGESYYRLNRMVEAARDLGASPLHAFFTVTVPLTLPGLMAGCVLVFIPSMGLFFLNDLLGGSKSVLAGGLIQQLINSRDLPMAAALSVLLLAVTGAVIGVYRKVGGTGDMSMF